MSVRKPWEYDISSLSVHTWTRWASREHLLQVEIGRMTRTEKKDRLCLCCKKKCIFIVETKEHVLSACACLEAERCLLYWQVVPALLAEGLLDKEQILEQNAGNSCVFALLDSIAKFLRELESIKKTSRKTEGNEEEKEEAVNLTTDI